MVHCKRSRIAKAPSDQSHPKYGAPFPRKPPGVSFSPEGIFWWHTSLGRASLSRWESRSDSWTAMQQGRGLFLPFASLRWQVNAELLSCLFFVFFFCSLGPGPAAGLPYSLSILNVSSVAGSASTMSGSLSMCSPSRVSGSIFSSSRGNWVSASKLTSPTPASELVSSLERLGGDSPVTETRDNRHRGWYPRAWKWRQPLLKVRPARCASLSSKRIHYVPTLCVQPRTDLQKTQLFFATRHFGIINTYEDLLQNSILNLWGTDFFSLQNMVTTFWNVRISTDCVRKSTLPSRSECVLVAFFCFWGCTASETTFI